MFLKKKITTVKSSPKHLNGMKISVRLCTVGPIDWLFKANNYIQKVLQSDLQESPEWKMFFVSVLTHLNDVKGQ